MELNLDFYTAAAQLIPLLLVAAAVDTRMWASPERQRHGDAVFEIATLFLVSFAWMASLLVIGTGESSRFAGAAVSLGLALGWIQVVGSIAVGQAQRLGRAKPTRRLRAWIFLVVASPLFGVAALWWTTL